MRAPTPICLAAAAVLFATLPRPAHALPAMIRLGYTNCAVCHIAPQGGGPLNDYGRGIDQAQSLRGGEYQPAKDGLFRALDLGGRIRQDVRLLLQQQGTWAGPASGGTLRARLMYRTVATLSDRLRFAGTVTGENGTALPAGTAHVLVNTALLHYRATDTIEVAVGKDQLPAGINVPDLALFIKARNRLGYRDVPAQVKVVVAGSRFQVTPFVYNGRTNEARGEHESGAGSLAEFDLLGTQRAVVGATLRRSRASSGDRRVAGAYARIGFGRWGVLAEHDVAHRNRSDMERASFRQDASYVQVFWAVRDWLVASATGERLRVGAPYAEHRQAGKIELAARLTSVATVIIGARVERNAAQRRISKALAVQLSLKTVE